mgnify:CR=1 FL=1
MYENHYNEHYQLARSHLCWITHRHPHIPLAYFLQHFPRQNTADKLMHIFLHITRLMQIRVILQSIVPVSLQRPFADVQQQANILNIVQPFPFR